MASAGEGAKSGAKAGSVFGPWGSAVGGALGGIVGAIGGNNQKKQEEAALRKYIEEMNNQTVLSANDYVSDYQQLDPNSLEFYDPAQEQDIQTGDTALAGITLDPAYKQAQMDALASLSRRGEEGLTLSEEAARNDIIGATGQAQRGAQEALIQQAARQGRLGAGDLLATQMASSGQAYDQAARQASDLAVQRDNRALQAVLGAGEFAGNVRNKEYGEQSDAAKARDAIAQFNARMREGAQQRNVSATNQAGETRAGALRGVTVSNLGLQNKQADQRALGLQASTAAQNEKAKSIADLKYGGANKSAAHTGQAASNIGKMIPGVIDTVGGLLNTDKEDDTPYVTTAAGSKLPGKLVP